MDTASHTTLSPPLTWSSLPRGRYIAAQLQQRLDDWAPGLFGFSLLKVDALSAALSLERSRLRQGVVMAQTEQENMDLLGDATAMPFSPGSLDACLLAHVLEYSAHPHAILREAETALRDDGWLILSGFNPYGSAGLARWLPGWRKRLPHWHAMVAPARVEDWLKLLGFEVIKRDYIGFTGFMPWLAHWQRQRCPQFCPSPAAVYILLARKRRFPLTPIQERRRAPAPVARPEMARQRE
ncbi:MULTISPECIES: class I SAM-dependent methyltransferase [Oceanimonas]|uniref:Class I SAM-dependent methyltransferase n=1 Tax=Oceanimonas smirnovii TaxID=264574 RepID=A0ABW7NY79_9GAMM|nr:MULTISPECIES: methyltransferase domain-containing protein [Oceanimonas]MDV2858244.1 methyltransferase domain-containing protein [Oceanimonas sp. CAM02]